MENEYKKCLRCYGSGKVWVFNYWKYYHIPRKGIWSTCPKCNGYGKIKIENKSAGVV